MSPFGNFAPNDNPDREKGPRSIWRCECTHGPSARAITSAYDGSGRVLTLAAGATPIATNVSYFPFGAAASWSWGNGSVAARSFDADGRMSALTLGPVGTRQVVYDAAGRITGLTDPVNALNNQTYGYDALDRVTNWTDSGSARAYTYDATGNRTSLAISGNTYLYTVAANSNRLLSTDGPPPARTFTYDGAGNITGNGQSTFTYNDRGRLVNANGATYVYDGLGQRVKKSGPAAIVPSGVNYYVYDEDGKLLGEYDASGAVISEYAYLDDQLIAVMRGPSAATEVFYVHTDQVGRPWVVTNTMDQPRWRWDTSPFGEFAPNDNPAGLGAFTFNVRFPGQYYDAESGLFYNMARDYDPAIGRYIQSDPVGLFGGINTYGYVGGNPLSRIDPTGEFFFIPAIIAAIAGGGTGTSTAVIGGAAVAAGAAWWITQNAAVVPKPRQTDPFSPAANDPAFGGGGMCPPPPDDPCGKMKNALNTMYNLLSKQTLSSGDLTGPDRFEILRQRRAFNEAVDQYNAQCANVTGAYNKRMPVGPQRPSLPGTSLIQDFYGR